MATSLPPPEDPPIPPPDSPDLQGVGAGPALPPGPFDVVVVGAGAAGLWAAGTAAARGRRVLLLEKGPRVGVKILASGGGHCNLTTTLAGSALLGAFVREQARFLGPSLRHTTPLEVRRVFEELGVPSYEGEWEKVWPVSMRARDVADALRRRAERAGVVLRTGAAVLDLARRGEGFLVRTRAGEVTAARVLVTVGGRSYPKTGTTGDGYGWLEALGHTITRTVPALAPLVVEVPWVRALAGISCVTRLVATQGGKVVAERVRPLLFTHTGLSGPGPMDVSKWFERAPPWDAATLRVDFLPTMPHETARRALAEAIQGAPAERIARALPGGLPSRLVEALCEAVGVPATRRATETSKAERHALLEALKHLPLPVAGTRGFDFAEVTAGGVALDEVDAATMASRLVPGLHVAGEILDVDGPIGGFNFQAAFATGESAGRAV